MELGPILSSQPVVTNNFADTKFSRPRLAVFAFRFLHSLWSHLFSASASKGATPPRDFLRPMRKKYRSGRHKCRKKQSSLLFPTLCPHQDSSQNRGLLFRPTDSQKISRSRTAARVFRSWYSRKTSCAASSPDVVCAGTLLRGHFVRSAHSVPPPGLEPGTSAPKADVISVSPQGQWSHHTVLLKARPETTQ